MRVQWWGLYSTSIYDSVSKYEIASMQTGLKLGDTYIWKDFPEMERGLYPEKLTISCLWQVCLITFPPLTQIHMTLKLFHSAHQTLPKSLLCAKQEAGLDGDAKTKKEDSASHLGLLWCSGEALAQLRKAAGNKECIKEAPSGAPGSAGLH